MAFDQPLEADRVEGNLLFSLVSGPIIGSLMWILGDDDAEKKQQEAELQRGLQDMVLDDIDTDDDSSTNPESRIDKSLPRLVRSDLSVHAEHNLHEGGPLLANENNSSLGQFKRPTEKKKMSWSENLVEYMDDESVRHEPPSAADGASPPMSKPIKSAMTRSTSMRSHPLAGGSAGAEDKERKIRYLPSGLDRAHNGLIMPTRPMAMGGVGMTADPHGNGIESPQWGWYINTTPPTPEMYHSRSSLKHTEKSDNSTASSSSDAQAYDNPAATRGPNRIFEGLKAGSNRPPVGWPSVPL